MIAGISGGVSVLSWFPAIGGSIGAAGAAMAAPLFS